MGKRTSCIVLSQSSRNEQALLGGAAAIISSTLHEGTRATASFPEISMRVHIGEESRYRGVGVDNIESIPRVDIVICRSRSSEVVCMTN